MVSCAHKDVKTTTSVTVIGTFHGAMKQMRVYNSKRLEEYLKSSAPELIIAEIRPEDFSINYFKNYPWDILEVVLPFANKNSIPVRPFDWWPDNLRFEYNQFYEKLLNTSEGQKIYQIVENEWAPFVADFPDFNDVTPEYVHSEKFADLSRQFRLNVKKLVGEGPQNLRWYQRAAEMNKNLDSIIDQNLGRKIVIVTGAFHRPDIEDYLKTKPQVKILSLF